MSDNTNLGEATPPSEVAPSSEYASPPPGDINKLIHEPARLMIMANLFVVESADFTFLMNQTGLTWGNISSHVTKLEEAGYIAVEKTFVGKRPYTLLHLTENGRSAFQTYRQQMSELLNNLPE